MPQICEYIQASKYTEYVQWILRNIFQGVVEEFIYIHWNKYILDATSKLKSPPVLVPNKTPAT